MSFFGQEESFKPGTHLWPGYYWDYVKTSCKPSAVDEDPTHLCWMDIFLDYFTFETLVSRVCEGLVLFHFKGKTGHKWQEFYGTVQSTDWKPRENKSPASLWKIKWKREIASWQKGGSALWEWRDKRLRNSSSGASEEFSRTLDLKTIWRQREAGVWTVWKAGERSDYFW